MPSRTHDLLARAVPRVRGSRDLDTEPAERARVERWHRGLDRSFPSRLVPFFDRRFTLVTQDLAGFPVHVLAPRGVAATNGVVAEDVVTEAKGAKVKATVKEASSPTAAAEIADAKAAPAKKAAAKKPAAPKAKKDDAGEA